MEPRRLPLFALVGLTGASIPVSGVRPGGARGLAVIVGAAFQLGAGLRPVRR